MRVITRKLKNCSAKNVKYANEPIINLIKAAEAAQQRGDDLEANKYLIEASKIGGENNIAVELARAKFSCNKVNYLQHVLLLIAY